MSLDASAVSSTATEVPFSAAEQAVISGDPTAYSAARAAERAGTPLEPTKPADTASATPEQAASTDAHDQPASEPGKGKGKGIEARKEGLKAEIAELQELLRLRRELREQAHAPEPGAKPADSPTAPGDRPTKRDIDRYKAMPDYPKAEEYEDYDDLVTARAEFVAEQKAVEREQKQRQEQQAGEFVKGRDAMLTKGREAFPDFDDVLLAAEEAGVTFPPHVVQEMLTDEHGFVLARELAERAVRERGFLASLANPVQAGRIIGQILASHTATPAPPPVSKAPAPPQMVGSKTSDVLDPLEAAVRSGSEEAYLAAKDAKRRAAMR